MVQDPPPNEGKRESSISSASIIIATSARNTQRADYRLLID
jgi:hypothetical protein